MDPTAFLAQRPRTSYGFVRRSHNLFSMFIGSSQSALRSKPQSVFDLRLSQSHRNEGESQFSQDYEWLYGQNSALAEAGAEATVRKHEELAANHSTDCLFFHQFMAIHQESPHIVRSNSTFNDQISTINTYLSGLTDDQSAANENAEANPST